MTKEFYIDGIGNISVQGPVITLTMTRVQQGSKVENDKEEEVLHLTMTGQNLLKITNILNNTIKRLAERSQSASKDTVENKANKDTVKNRDKDQTVNWLLVIFNVIIQNSSEYVFNLMIDFILSMKLVVYVWLGEDLNRMVFSSIFNFKKLIREKLIHSLLFSCFIKLKFTFQELL